MNNIARYNGGVWSPLQHKGLNGDVRALAVSGNDLYVGGQFDFTPDLAVTNLTNIARYSGGAWSALDNHGLNGIVMALAINGNDLYVGGAFSKTQDGLVTDLNRIAKYNFLTGEWSGMAHKGLNGNVIALNIIGNDLYAGGYFTKSFDNSVTNLNYIARYDTIGGAWSVLPNGGLSNPVDVLAIIGGDLYVGGDFGGTADGSYTDQFVKLGSSVGFSLFLPVVLK